VRCAGLDDLGGALGCGAAEHEQVEQRVGAEPGGAVYRDASRLADRHQTRHGAIGIARGRVQYFAMNIGRDAAHVVMCGGQYRDRLARYIDTGKDLRGLRNARQPRLQ